MADYCITGVWFSETNGKKYISHVLLHQLQDRNYYTGYKRTKDFVINLLRQNKEIITLVWSYDYARWDDGQRVGIETVQNVEYIRTLGDRTKKDNLDNLISMSGLFE